MPGQTFSKNCECSDTKTLPLIADLLFDTPGIRGREVPDAENTEVLANDFKNGTFLRPSVNAAGVVSYSERVGGDPAHGHAQIAYYKPMLEALRKEVGKLKPE
jgi:hypothetical protein